MLVTKQEIEREIALKLLEKNAENERNSFYQFLLRYWKDERKMQLDENWHLKLICDKLEDVFYGRTKRLMINIPPRSLKTEIVSIAFPARCLGKRHEIKFMGISYATGLAQQNSMACRNMYTSQTFQYIFPRAPELKEDLNTKTHRENLKG